MWYSIRKNVCKTIVEKIRKRKQFIDVPQLAGIDGRKIENVLRFDTPSCPNSGNKFPVV